MESILASWRRQSAAIKVLRAFLGLTFIYAGWDKASDPNFISQGFAESVGAFATTSPISSLLNVALEHSTLFAWLIIVGEIAVGLFTLLGVAGLTAALGGVALTLTLWLSSSWNVRPYFLAADPAYFVLWVVYALTLFSTRSRRALTVDRRGFLRIALAAAGAGLIALVGRRFTGSASTATGTGVPLDSLEVGQAAPFQSSQGAAVVIRTGESEVVAYSAKCTHEGCTVAYESSRKLLVCPCHGATFDPAKKGAPTAPASRPLPEITVRIDSSGEIVES